MNDSVVKVVKLNYDLLKSSSVFSHFLLDFVVSPFFLVWFKIPSTSCNRLTAIGARCTAPPLLPTQKVVIFNPLLALFD